MNMLLRPNLTAEEFEEMPDTDGAELIDGIPLEREMGSESSFVGGRVLILLAAAGVGRHGMLFPADQGFICFPHRPRLVRKPDVSFVRNGRFPNDRPPRGFARLVPDLAVEVISPNDTYYEVEDRLNDYLLVGVPLVWIVNPDRRTVHTYTPDGTIRRLTAEQELTGEPLFPDFRVRVADLFPEPLPEPPPEATPPATA
ncbi:MAG: Uma2 family endonuclease [Armatimonadaceae bacterium]